MWFLPKFKFVCVKWYFGYKLFSPESSSSVARDVRVTLRAWISRFATPPKGDDNDGEKGLEKQRMRDHLIQSFSFYFYLFCVKWSFSRLYKSETEFSCYVIAGQWTNTGESFTTQLYCAKKWLFRNYYNYWILNV